MSNYKVKENAAIGEKYYYIKHKSGLDIYVIPKNHGTAYALFGTKYGSIHSIFKTGKDEDFITVPDGVAHFLEHKMFEDENGVDTFKRFAETGASANAYTSSDKTCYLFSCTENIDKSLEILLDFVTHPYFTEATVQKEQGIIGQELRMYQDNPGWRVFFGMLAALYKEHSIRIDTGGTIESISKITPDILYRCYRTFYNLGNMALCVCGNVTPEQVEAVADKVLEKSEDIEIQNHVYNEPSQVQSPRVECKLRVAQPMFCIGIKDNDTGYENRALSEKCAQIGIINEIIFGKAGELYTSLYEEGLINSKFGAGYDSSPTFAYIEIAGEGRDPDLVLEKVLDKIEDFKAKGISTEDFERAKRVVYARSVKVFDSTDDIANSFLGFIFQGSDMLDMPEIIGAVTLEQVNARLCSTYNKESCAISVVSPIQ